MDFKEAIKAYAKAMKVSEAEAKGDAERTIKQWMEKKGYTREFAEASWIEDQEDLNPEELDEMEKKAKASGATKVKARREVVDPAGKKKTRERKPNEDKRFLISCLYDNLNFHDVEDCAVINPEKQIDFHLHGVHYSVTLTAHRPPKDKGKA